MKTYKELLKEATATLYQDIISKNKFKKAKKGYTNGDVKMIIDPPTGDLIFTIPKTNVSSDDLTKLKKLEADIEKDGNTYKISLSAAYLQKNAQKVIDILLK